MYPLLRLRFIRHFDGREDYEAGPANLPSVGTPIERISGFRRPATRAHLSIDFRRWDPSWIPGIPFGRLPSNIPEVPIVLFEMRELETMLPFPLPSLRLEALGGAVLFGTGPRVTLVRPNNKPRLTVGDSEIYEYFSYTAIS